MVEQVDREAAAALLASYFQHDEAMRKLAADYEMGHSSGQFVQAFASHRQQAERLLIAIAQACLDQGYPLAVALEMMKGQNDG